MEHEKREEITVQEPHKFWVASEKCLNRLRTRNLIGVQNEVKMDEKLSTWRTLLVLELVLNFRLSIQEVVSINPQRTGKIILKSKP